MVWEKKEGCITNINWDNAYLEAPMTENGPDMSKRTLHGIVATYKPDCGRIEVRK